MTSSQRVTTCSAAARRAQHAQLLATPAPRTPAQQRARCGAHSALPHRQAHRRDSTALKQHGVT
jgi:hypothetical protein